MLVYNSTLTTTPSAYDTQLNPDSNSIRNQKIILYSLLIVGISFRLFHFFHNRSLFIDELYLNINLIKMDFWGLATLPFEYEQKAPIGYLWAVKLFVVLFGKGEKALRLFSLLCGISALFVFIPVARYFLKSWGVVLAVGIMAISWTLIYHSVEAKQYSTELFATVLALYFYTKYNRSTDLPSLLLWGIVGGILLWFSFSLIFVLVSIAAISCLGALLNRDSKRFFSYLIPFSMWAASFILLYLLFLGKYHESGWLIDFFEKEYDAFMPLSISSFSDVIWFIRTPYSLLHHPLGLLLNLSDDIKNSGVKFILKLGWLQTLFIVFGMIMLFRKDWKLFLLLTIPILIVFLASGFKVYPVYGRFMVFLTPIIILFLAFGLESIYYLFHQKKITYTLLALLIISPLVNSTSQIFNPSLLSGATEREAILYIDKNFKEGDAVYVFWNMRHAYGFYKEAYGLKYTATQASYVKNTSTSAEDYIRNLSSDFKNFKGKKRLWFIYDPNNHDNIGDYLGQPTWYHEESFHAEQEVEKEFSKFGKRVMHQQNPFNSLSISLFELNQ